MYGTRLHVNAGNDRSGNPRRLWLISGPDGSFLGAMEEDDPRLKSFTDNWMPDSVSNVGIPISVRAYKSLKKNGMRK